MTIGFTCPNLDGSESPTYDEHNESAGLAERLRRFARMADRARTLATFEERDVGVITLYMSKHELQARLRQAEFLQAFGIERDHYDSMRKA